MKLTFERDIEPALIARAAISLVGDGNELFFQFCFGNILLVQNIDLAHGASLYGGSKVPVHPLNHIGVVVQFHLRDRRGNNNG